MHLILGTFVFAIMLLVSALMLLSWVATKIIGWISRGLMALFPVQMNDRLRLEPLPTMCRRDGCHAANPTEARFCRRCGVALELGRYESAYVGAPNEISSPGRPIAI